jgi:ATP-dependent protease ClpP protease subunit
VNLQQAPAQAAEPYEAAGQPDRPRDSRLLFEPNISINGLITSDTLGFFLGRLQAVRQDGIDLIMELNTDGGDADVARRIALEIRLFCKHSKGKAYCVGKTKVYSAGVTILAAFPRRQRYVTEDAVLLVHERHMQQSISLNGPLKACIQIVREQLALLETAEQLEREGFEELVQGTCIAPEQLYEKATQNCYITADEAVRIGIVSAILG